MLKYGIGLRMFLLIMVLLSLSTHGYAATRTVTNANDSGSGSLRYTIAIAAFGDTIVFDNDYTIRLASRLEIQRSVTIDGAGHNITISGDTDGDGDGDVPLLFIAHYVGGQPVTLKNLHFTKGYDVSDLGGGHYASGAINNDWDASALTIQDCLIDYNTSGHGGGIRNPRSPLIIENTEISHNTATREGGGVKTSYGTVTISNSVIRGNTSLASGGGIYMDNANLTLVNSLIVENEAVSYGGGALYLGWNATTTITNSTLANNRSPGSWSYYSNIIFNRGTLNLRNTIIANNTAQQVYVSDPGGLLPAENIRTLMDEAGLPGLWYIGDPHFVDAAGGDFRLAPVSPAIDAGDNASATGLTTDLDGNPRLVDACSSNGTVPTVDIGAYEYQDMTNTPPTISDIADFAVNEDTTSTPVAFTIGDDQGREADLILTAISNNQRLLPDANITFGGSGPNRTLIVTPAPDQHGTATVTVTVIDGGCSAFDDVVVTVNPMPESPVAGFAHALELNGSNQYMSLPEAVWFSGDFTIEAWVYLPGSSYPNWAPLLDFGNGEASDNVVFALSQGTTGRPALQTFQEDGTSVLCSCSAQIPFKQWTHLAATIEGTTGRIYVNGTECGIMTNMPVPRNIARTQNYIGRSNWAAYAYANAIFDEVRVWDIARTPAQLQATIYLALNSANEANLRGYWPLNELDGTAAADATANENDGTLHGNPLQVSINSDLRPALSVAQNTAFSGILPIYDDDGDPLSYSFVNSGSKGTAVVNNAATGAFTYTPALNAFGSETLTYQATAGADTSTEQSVNVTIRWDGMPTLVKDIYPGGSDAYPDEFENMANMAFFQANDGTHGYELWQTDGTAAGTLLVKDIRTGGSGSYPEELTAVNGMMFFAANDGVNGKELWRTDGTESGTQMVKDIAPGSDSSDPYELIVMNGMLFFVASTDEYGYELWQSDGTADGTVIVKDIAAGSTDSEPEYLTVGGNALYFSAYTEEEGYELWTSDGTTDGTVLVKDIYPGAEGSYPDALTALDGHLFFVAEDDTHGSELWQSDGTEAGTVLVKDIVPGSDYLYPYNLLVVNGRLYFILGFPSQGTPTLWTSDGTAAGTVMVKDIAPTSDLVRVNNTFFFSADDGVHGKELWMSDGTAVGTVMLKDIWPDTGSSAPGALHNINGMLCFTADDGMHGRELWQSDGTPAGTVLVADLLPGSVSAFDQYEDIEWNLNGIALWNHSDLVYGQELWRYTPDTPPVVESPVSANITMTSAALGGNVTTIGAGNVTERGIYWSTTQGFVPPGQGTKVSATGNWSAPGAFTLPVTGLPTGETIYFQAFATNTIGAGYTPPAAFATFAPEINIKQGSTNLPSGSGQYGFGTITVGQTASATFTIENLGNSALNLTSETLVAISGTDASLFTVTQNPSTPVAASGSTSFVVRFAPTSAGAKTATVTIANNDSDENPYTFTLTGSGQAPSSGNSFLLWTK